MSPLTLRGRWTGEVGEPGRSFQGTVEDPGHTGLQPGGPVAVTFEPGAARDHTSPQAHGRYRLEGMPSVNFVLVSFTRQDGDHDDRAMQDDGEQFWGGDIFTGP